jgi:hypothetical protein
VTTSDGKSKPYVPFDYSSLPRSPEPQPKAKLKLKDGKIVSVAVTDSTSKSIAPKEKANEPTSPLRQLSSLASTAAIRADALKERLKEAVKAMTVLPFKMAISVEGANRDFARFERAGDSWTVYYDFLDDENGDQRSVEWVSASIDQKARLAQILPSLFRELSKRVRDQVTALESAHASLDELDAEMQGFSRGHSTNGGAA